jgi:putative transcriptional regulator
MWLPQDDLRQANAEKGHFDAEKFESLTDADIDRMIAQDPELAPPTQSLAPPLDMREIRRKLRLTQAQLAKNLHVAVATLREWEHGRGQTDPALQALLRALDKLPEPALPALDEPPRRAGIIARLRDGRSHSKTSAERAAARGFGLLHSGIEGCGPRASIRRVCSADAAGSC